VRQSADHLARTISAARTILGVWTARGGTTFIPDDDTAIIIDGAADDGRPVINGQDVNNIMALLQAAVTSYEANDDEKLIEVLRVAVRPTSPIGS
jgi:hypothetical protein